MIHFRKGKMRYHSLCGKYSDLTAKTMSSDLTSNRSKVTCQRCIQILEVKDRKKVEKADKTNVKKLEKEVTALWRHSVWLIYGGTCALCGKQCNDHNSHHFFTKGSHAATRYEPYCGILLDYGCHIGKVHRGGETEKLRDILIAKIGTTMFEQVKEKSYTVSKNVDLLKVKQYLEEFVRCQL